MTEPRRKVTVDGEMLLNRLDAIDRATNDIRNLVITSLPSPGSPAGINIGIIDWRTKDNQPATEETTWAWAHAYHQGGGLKDETRQLVQEIERTGKIKVSGYEIGLGGRDGRLLNRMKLGSGRR